jgi:hypothetical protein
MGTLIFKHSPSIVLENFKLFVGQGIFCRGVVVVFQFR